MKKIALLFLISLLALAPAQARRIASVTITTAVTNQTTAPFQISKPPTTSGISIQINFTYGSGGTSVSAWLQTSLDGGATWNDVAAPAAITTASVKSVFNVSAETPALTPIATTDGSLAAGTAKDGLVGPIWRLKYTSVGTYAGGTTLTVDLNGPTLTTP